MRGGRVALGSPCARVRRTWLTCLAVAAVLCVALGCAGRASAVTTVRGRYGAGAHRSLVTFMPTQASSARRPAVLFFHSHGGGPFEFTRAAAAIAQEGAIAVLVDYDVDARWPKQPTG